MLHDLIFYPGDDFHSCGLPECILSLYLLCIHFNDYTSSYHSHQIRPSISTYITFYLIDLSITKSFSFKISKIVTDYVPPPPSTLHNDILGKLEKRESAYIALGKYIYIELYFRFIFENISGNSIFSRHLSS